MLGDGGLRARVRTDLLEASSVEAFKPEPARGQRSRPAAFARRGAMARSTRSTPAQSTWLMTATVLLFGLTVASTSSGQSRDVVRRNHRPVHGRYLVAIGSTDDPEALASAMQGLGRGRVRHVYRHAFRGFAIEMSEATARTMAADPGVRYVEEDGLVEASSVESLDASSSWGLDRIDQRVIRKAGALAYDHLYRYAAAGAGVNVYVVDTGVRTTHVEFGGRAFAAFDARAYENVDGDCNGHGTHVAGIIGGSRVGVAKLVTLHSVRVLGCDGTGYVSDLVAGIDWIVANQRKPAVINMSIQALPNATFSDALRGAIAAGITFVAAAGNDSSDACFGLTGDVPDAIVVGASDIADSRAGFSNFGACVDLFAPGDAILSSWASDDSAYVYMRGTSQAAPHVAGAAALYLQGEPDASPQQVASVILADATTDVIIVPGTGSPNRLLFTPQLGDTMPPRVSVIAPVPGGSYRAFRPCAYPRRTMSRSRRWFSMPAAPGSGVRRWPRIRRRGTVPRHPMGPARWMFRRWIWRAMLVRLMSASSWRTEKTPYRRESK